MSARGYRLLLAHHLWERIDRLVAKLGISTGALLNDAVDRGSIDIERDANLDNRPKSCIQCNGIMVCVIVVEGHPYRNTFGQLSHSFDDQLTYQCDQCGHVHWTEETVETKLWVRR